METPNYVITKIVHDFDATIFDTRDVQTHFEFPSIDKYINWICNISINEYVHACSCTPDEITHIVKVYTRDFNMPHLENFIKVLQFHLKWDFGDIKIIDRQLFKWGWKFGFKLPPATEEDKCRFFRYN